MRKIVWLFLELMDQLLSGRKLPQHLNLFASALLRKSLQKHQQIITEISLLDVCLPPASLSLLFDAST